MGPVFCNLFTFSRLWTANVTNYKMMQQSEGELSPRGLRYIRHRVGLGCQKSMKIWDGKVKDTTFMGERLLEGVEHCFRWIHSIYWTLTNLGSAAYLVNGWGIKRCSAIQCHSSLDLHCYDVVWNTGKHPQRKWSSSIGNPANFWDKNGQNNFEFWQTMTSQTVPRFS